MKRVFLGLTVVGAVVPYVFFTDFLFQEGVWGFVPALFVNGAAGGFTADLLISSLVFWTALYWRGAERMWLYVLVNLTIGLSCALPLYCYLNFEQEERLRTSSQ